MGQTKHTQNSNMIGSRFESSYPLWPDETITKLAPQTWLDRSLVLAWPIAIIIPATIGLSRYENLSLSFSLNPVHSSKKNKQRMWSI